LLISPWLGIYPLVEASFYLLVYLPRRAYLQRAAQHPPLSNRPARQILFNRCLKFVDSDVYPSRWFFSTDIKRENVVEWVLWAIFSSDREHASLEWREEIDGYVASIEGQLGKKFEHGYNGNVKSMRLTLDPVVMAHRPLIWYGVSFRCHFSCR